MTVREFKSTKNYVTDKYETGIVWRRWEKSYAYLVTGFCKKNRLPLRKHQ